MSLESKTHDINFPPKCLQWDRADFHIKYTLKYHQKASIFCINKWQQVMRNMFETWNYYKNYRKSLKLLFIYEFSRQKFVKNDFKNCNSNSGPNSAWECSRN